MSEDQIKTLTTIAALVVAFVALANVGLSQWNEKGKRDIEALRLRLELSKLYIPDSVQSLKRLYVSLMAYYEEIEDFRNAQVMHMPTVVERVLSKEEAFREARIAGLVHLDKKGRKLVFDVQDALSQVTAAILRIARPTDERADFETPIGMHYRRLDDAAREAFLYFQECLNMPIPDSIKKAKS